MSNPVPINIKKLTGTVQPCRDKYKMQGNDVPVLDIMPNPPDWLIGHDALTAWKNTGQLLINLKMLSPVDLPAFAQMCALEDKVIEIYKSGETPHNSQLATLRAFYADFGIAPMARQRLKMTVAAPTSNKFTKK